MSQWNKCWSLHLKLIFILLGLALKIIWISFCIAFLLQYLCVINILNRGLCYLVELDSWKVCRHLHVSSLDIDWSRKERSPKNISKDFQNLGFLGLAILRHICFLGMEGLLISTFPICNFSPIMQKESLFHPSADLQFRFMPCACAGRYHLFQQTDEIFVTYKDMLWRATIARAPSGPPLLNCLTY